MKVGLWLIFISNTGSPVGFVPDKTYYHTILLYLIQVF
ncbi:hypothetical protein THERMOS_583 [Bathymodiolus thermophilus thioautotrophic gill symbiont]|uniref:Uncharacterized protein n=1 Tax=Bathymodiolus thermophilus thioautotrophic gill symbiont TaxID=2360 RepID=A0A8H8XBT8_9GAMM|nr:hypothetical protein THERMOS_583 [Bathymodiolus thermophilus thioautotrophic gill symbiont]